MKLKLKFKAIDKFIVSIFVTYFSIISLSLASNASDLFTVKNIYVDVTASSSSIARDKAMKTANRIAVSKVIKSLVLKSDLERLPEIEDADLINYILETSVSDEKTSSIRYMATLNIKTNEKSIKKYLVDNQVPFVLEIAPKALVLPLFSPNGQKAILWENNKWLEIWKNNKFSSTLVPLIIPAGDAKDINAISVSQAEVLNSQAISDIAKSYSVKDVYVINGSYKGDGMFEAYIQFLSEKNPFFTSVELKVTPEMSDDVVLYKAQELVQYEIEDVWKKQNVISYDQVTNAVVVAKIVDLKDWLFIKSKISLLSFVKNVELRAIKKGQAQFEMNFFGDKYRLISSLEGEGLKLYEYGDIWVVERTDKVVGE